MSCNLFWFKLYFVWYCTASPALRGYHLLGVSFPASLCQPCSRLWVSSERLVDSMWLDHVLLSILPISVFWLESLIHWHFMSLLMRRDLVLSLCYLFSVRHIALLFLISHFPIFSCFTGFFFLMKCFKFLLGFLLCIFCSYFLCGCQGWHLAP